MIVESILLENWKKFRLPKEFHFSNGINIIYGPNESGKTTIVDSLRTTIFSKHTSKTQKVKASVPWNSSLSPHASITFQNRGERYKLTKKFVKGESLLERWNNGHWDRIAEGDVADKDVVNIVGGDLPRTGDSKPHNWGLGQSLWMVQGDPIITDELNPTTISSLQTMIGASIESEDEKKVINNIEQFYSTIFTRTGKLKKNSGLSELEETIEGLESRLSSARNNLAQKEELLRGLEDGEFTLQMNRKLLQEAEDMVKKLKKDVEEANKHEIEREKIEGEVNTLQTKYLALKEKIDDIKQITDSIEELNSENDEISGKMNTLQEDNHSLQKDIDLLNTQSIELKSKSDTLESEKRFASIALTTIKEEMDLENKNLRLQEVEELDEALIHQKRELSSFIAPTKSELKAIEKLDNKIKNTEAQLDAIGLTISARSQGSFSGELLLDGESEEFKLETDDQNNWKAHQSVKIQIKDLGEFEIKSGSQDVEEMRSSLEAMQLEYDSKLASYKCSDLDQLRDSLIKKDRLIADIERSETVLNKKFKEGKGSLLKEIGELENKIKYNWGIIPEDSPYNMCQESDKNSATSLLSSKINKLESEIDELKSQNTDLEGKIKSLQTNKKGLDENISEIKSQIYGNQQVIESNNDRLLNIGKDGLDIYERESKLDQISVDLERKERVLKVFREEVEEVENKPKKAHKIYEEKIKRLQTDIRNIELAKAKNEADIENLIKTSEDANKLEEQVELHKKQLKELEIEAEAAKLLYELTEYYHETTITSLTSPIEKLVTENLRKLIGPKYSVEFGSNAKPSCVIPEGRNHDASLDVLSFGTQEQIWCLFRLALGQLLGVEEKQLVVLDDPFVNTDPLRLHHALEIIEECSKNLQIIILTCNVDDYDQLSDANLIPMV